MDKKNFFISREEARSLKIWISRDMLYEAIDAQPEIVGATYTDRVMEILLELVQEEECKNND